MVQELLADVSDYWSTLVTHMPPYSDDLFRQTHPFHNSLRPLNHTAEVAL